MNFKRMDRAVVEIHELTRKWRAREWLYNTAEADGIIELYDALADLREQAGKRSPGGDNGPAPEAKT